MSKLEFDDELSRVVEEFNASPGATRRRAKILGALALRPGQRVLDVGSGPGNQALEIASAVGSSGRVDGVDVAESAIEIARQRCSDLSNVAFHLGKDSKLPFDNATFDVAMSSQVFEYLDDIPNALIELHRVLKPGGRALIHDTDWGAVLWHSTDPERMARVMKTWDSHLADPHLPRSLGNKLTEAGFLNVRAEPIVQIELSYDPSSVSGILMQFIVGYVVSQGMPQSEADAWAADLVALGSRGSYFFSSNEYMFIAERP
jgi:arsenite methyltransferase